MSSSNILLPRVRRVARLQAVQVAGDAAAQSRRQTTHAEALVAVPGRVDVDALEGGTDSVRDGTVRGAVPCVTHWKDAVATAHEA
eukprot:3520578-Rhodomonas_salina.2